MKIPAAAGIWDHNRISICTEQMMVVTAGPVGSRWTSPETHFSDVQTALLEIPAAISSYAAHHVSKLTIFVTTSRGRTEKTQSTGTTSALRLISLSKVPRYPPLR